MTVNIDDLTVGITTYKRPTVLAETLTSLEGVPNVRVVLNGSSMAEYEATVREFFGRAEFSQNVSNLGVAATANRLLMESSTRYLIWATDSCRFTDSWWDGVLELLNDDDPPMQISLSAPKRFTAVLIDKKLIAQQGFYDHNYTQVYYEDEDMFLRSLERLGLHNRRVELNDAMAVLSVVKSKTSSKKSWNSIPNRMYFWKKWERVDSSTEGWLHLRDSIYVKRRQPEPEFPYLSLIRQRYQVGDFSAVPFVYDEPSLRQRRLTRWTSNPLITRTRYMASRLFNPSQQLK